MAGQKIITQPLLEPIDINEMKLHLRIGADDNDELDTIEALIKAARQKAENDTGGRAFITQTWELTMDEFPEEIVIPRPPLQSVTSIKYLDSDGVLQTLAATVYSIDTYSEPGVIRLAYDQEWPATRSIDNAVTVRFVAGYGSLRTDVPETLRTAIKLLVGHWYESREAVLIGTTSSVVDLAYDSLVHMEKVHSV